MSPCGPRGPLATHSPWPVDSIRTSEWYARRRLGGGLPGAPGYWRANPRRGPARGSRRPGRPTVRRQGHQLARCRSHHVGVRISRSPAGAGPRPAMPAPTKSTVVGAVARGRGRYDRIPLACCMDRISNVQVSPSWFTMGGSSRFLLASRSRQSSGVLEVGRQETGERAAPVQPTATPWRRTGTRRTRRAAFARPARRRPGRTDAPAARAGPPGWPVRRLRPPGRGAK